MIVVCTQTHELTDPALEQGHVYDLLEVLSYGSVEFFRVGVRGLWSVLNLACDFEVLDLHLEEAPESTMSLELAS
jgi:hypothetical protein